MASTIASSGITRPTLRIGVSHNPPTAALREVWQYRELLWFFVWRDVKIRYKQTVIGAAWAVLQPVATMVVFSLFFGRLAKLPTNGLPYPLFYYCALLPWSYFASALQNATNVVVDQQRLITKTYFPRLVLPISAVLSALVDFAIAFSVLMFLMAYYHIRPGAAVLLLPVFLLLAAVTALSFGLWFSALNAVYRDVRYIVPFLIQFWMFASPVVYSTSLVPQRWHWLYGLNPMAGVIEGFRSVFASTSMPSGSLLATSSCGVVLVLVSGFSYFRTSEGTIADLV